MQNIRLLIRIMLCAVTMYSGLANAQDTTYKAQYLKWPNLAQKPPMGWNSWNRFKCEINESLIREMADAMVSTGMREAGYEYINIDDCWQGKRDSLGFMHPDPNRFPSGMKALADYVHSKGLKIGLYSDAGSMTCGGRPGSRGFEFQDAMQYAAWGIDYLKYDWCYTDGLAAEGAYKTITAALRAAGRPMVLSICEWGQSKPWQWAPQVGHLWRTTTDIHPCYDCKVDHGYWEAWGVKQILDAQDSLRIYAKPGAWNDPDMLEVGNAGLNKSENRTHFAMWCMLSAPLIAGNDLRQMDDFTRQLLTHKALINIDQDELGIQAFKLEVVDSIEVWLKPLSGGKWAMAWLNSSNTERRMTFHWQQKRFYDPLTAKLLPMNEEIQIQDAWTERIIGKTSKALERTIAPHDTHIFVLTPISKPQIPK